MVKPTLREIAAMPFPASQQAMRKHYDANWGLEPVGKEGPRKFLVKAEWSISGDFAEVIEAESEEEAKDKAKEWVMDDSYSGHLLFDLKSISEVEE